MKNLVWVVLILTFCILFVFQSLILISAIFDGPEVVSESTVENCTVNNITDNDGLTVYTSCGVYGVDYADRGVLADIRVGDVCDFGLRTVELFGHQATIIVASYNRRRPSPRDTEININANDSSRVIFNL